MLIVFPAFHMFLMRWKDEDDKGGLPNNNRDSSKHFFVLAPFSWKISLTIIFLFFISFHVFVASFFIQSKGHSPTLLLYLHEVSKYTGDFQMKTLLQAIVDRKEVTTPAVLSRVNFILTGW